MKRRRGNLEVGGRGDFEEDGNLFAAGAIRGGDLWGGVGGVLIAGCFW